jgi:hypothetical protein
MPLSLAVVRLVYFVQAWLANWVRKFWYWTTQKFWVKKSGSAVVVGVTSPM